MMFENGTQAYPELIRKVLHEGDRSAPRGSKITEIHGVVFTIKNANEAVPAQRSRKLNHRFGIMEGLMLLWGEYPADIVLAVNPRLSEFTNAAGYWDGAYAPRIKDWVPFVIDTLKKDPDSRRAVVPIYGDADRREDSKDIACTTNLQFLIREGKLCLIASMRSNDLLWGTPNDIAQFTMLQRGVAAALGIKMGWYKHFAGSLHIYDSTSDQLYNVIDADAAGSDEYALPYHPEWPHMFLDFQRSQIMKLFDGFRRNSIPDDIQEPFRTYAEILLKRRVITFSKEYANQKAS